jgi:beta-phosphoglucomutase-like phosphatase (HAD superfamily)
MGLHALSSAGWRIDLSDKRSIDASKQLIPMSCEAIFFDFDGVLVDSVEVKTQAFEKLFEPYGQDIKDKVVAHHRNHGGMTRRDKFHYYYENYLRKPLTNQKLNELCNAFADIVIEKVIAAPAIPGAEDLLRNCENRIPCFVISGTPTDELREIIKRRGWSRYFIEVCGAPVKKCEHLKILLSKYTLHPGSCIFFGDAVSDYEAAATFGIPFIGILPDEEAHLLKSIPGVQWIKNFNALNR